MSIDSLDRVSIIAWHEGWHPAFLDAVMPYWREKETWFPLYGVLVVWLIWRFRKTGILTIVFAAITVGLADFTAAGIIKPIVGRLRPCSEPGVWEHLDLITGCGPGLSMPSAHAANHFALAVFLGLTCFDERPTPKWIFVLWATTIALGQVYVGRHYFSDILAGAGIGSLIGFFMWQGFKIAEIRLNLATPTA